MKGGVLVVLALGLGACAPGYYFGRTGTAAAAGKPAGCPFALLEEPPNRPFDELGVIAPPDIEYGNVAGGQNSFREAVDGMVCGAGGDAVVVEKDERGRYIRGTVIHWKS